jgi:hypothetical protein
MAAVPYLLPDDVRARRPVGQVDDDVLAMHVAEFEQVAEDYLNVANTPRTATAVVGQVQISWLTPGSPTTQSFLRPMLRSITSTIAIDGLTTCDPPTILDAETGVISATIGWPSAVVVTYSHGFDAPSPLLLRACALYVDRTIASDRSGTSRDVLTQTFDGGTTRYSTPSKKDGRPTGYLDVDALLNLCPMFARSGVQ